MRQLDRFRNNAIARCPIETRLSRTHGKDQEWPIAIEADQKGKEMEAFAGDRLFHRFEREVERTHPVFAQEQSQSMRLLAPENLIGHKRVARREQGL